MVRDRGFGFIRGDDGKEVFFHRSGLNAADYDVLSEGDTVEYVVQPHEGLREDVDALEPDDPDLCRIVRLVRDRIEFDAASKP